MMKKPTVSTVKLTLPRMACAFSQPKRPEKSKVLV